MVSGVMASKLPTSDEYRRLFEEIEAAGAFTDGQKRMLKYHVEVERPVTATELAEHVGFEDWRGVNLQYGRVGKLLRERSAVLAALDGQESHAFARFDQIPRKDKTYPEWVWTLHPPVVDALRRLPWLTG
jgi:hypothetical protein